jgi:hypothetical protein
MVQTGILPDWVAFWLALTPLALLAAARPNLRFAAVTLMIVPLFPISGDPFLRPLDRIARSDRCRDLARGDDVRAARCRADVLTASGRLIADIADLLDRALRGELDHDTIETIDEACRTHLQEIYGAVAEARWRVAHPAPQGRSAAGCSARPAAAPARQCGLRRPCGDRGGELPSVDAARCRTAGAGARVVAAFAPLRARRVAAEGYRARTRRPFWRCCTRRASSSPPIQFTLGMLHEDLERAVGGLV